MCCVRVEVGGKVMITGDQATARNRYGLRPGVWSFWFDDPVSHERRRLSVGAVDRAAAVRQAWAIVEVVFSLTREQVEAERSAARSSRMARRGRDGRRRVS